MSKEIVVNVGERETRIAVLEDSKLAELHIEREERVVGGIYKARVENVLAGMDAAFVDCGLERNAFLYVGDVLPGMDGSGSSTSARSPSTVMSVAWVQPAALPSRFNSIRSLLTCATKASGVLALPVPGAAKPSAPGGGCGPCWLGQPPSMQAAVEIRIAAAPRR